MYKISPRVGQTITVGDPAGAFSKLEVIGVGSRHVTLVITGPLHVGVKTEPAKEEEIA